MGLNEPPKRPIDLPHPLPRRGDCSPNLSKEEEHLVD
jgi:hypothetical protein